MHGSRHEVYTWAKSGYGYENEVDTQYFDKQVKFVKDAFKKKYVKWWAIYEHTVNTDTGQVSLVMLDGNNHEEAPLLEINPAAKGWKPEPKKPKKPKAMPMQFTLPPVPEGLLAQGNGGETISFELL